MPEVQISETEYKKRIDRVKVCGENRGPHNYIPVAWVQEDKHKHVETLMCTVCFQRVNMTTLYSNFSEAKV